MPSIYGAASNHGWRLRLDYTLTPNPEDNTTIIDQQLYIYFVLAGDGAPSYNLNANSAWYSIGDSGVIYKTFRFTATGWYKWGERTVTVPHNPDGTGTVTLSAQWNRGSIMVSSWTPVSLSVGDTVTLPAIDRAAAMTVPDLTVGSAATLTVSPIPGTTHAVTYVFGGASGTAVSATDGAALRWTPPEALCDQLPTATAGTGTLTLHTYRSGTEIGHRDYPFTLYLPETVRPTASLSVAADNSDSGLPVSWTIAVQGRSRLAYTVTAQPGRGATVQSVTFRWGSQTAAGASGTTARLTEAGSLPCTAVVTDSRGRSATATAALTVWEYAAPSLPLAEVRRCNAAAVEDEEGAYLRFRARGGCTSLGGRNTVTLTARYRPSGGTWSTAVTLTPDTARLVGGTLSAETTYEAEITAADTAGDRRSILVTVPTARVALHLRPGGRGVGVGKYAESDAFECALPAVFTGGVTVDGKNVLDAVWPVGSVYIGCTAADPSTLLGGTWVSTPSYLDGIYAWIRTL